MCFLHPLDQTQWRKVKLMWPVYAWIRVFHPASESYQATALSVALFVASNSKWSSTSRLLACMCIVLPPLYISDHLHTPHILTNLWPAGLWPFIPFGHHTLPPNFIPKSVHLNAFPSPCTLEKAKSCLRTMLLQSHHNQIRRAKGPPPLLKWTLLRATFLGWGGSKDGR